MTLYDRLAKEKAGRRGGYQPPVSRQPFLRADDIRPYDVRAEKNSLTKRAPGTRELSC